MTLCVIDGGHCSCQPDIEAWCPRYKPDEYTRHLMRAISELRAADTEVRETCRTYVTMYEAELERSTARRADAERIDWLQSWTEGDVQIVAPGPHRGPNGGWLVALDSDKRPSGTRGYRWSCEASGKTLREASGKTLREAIDNCRRMLEAIP
jgi:hypothetical protein